MGAASGNSTFYNCSTNAAAGGAVNVALYSGTGTVGFGQNTFEANVALVGGAISVVDANETNQTPFYLEGNSFGENCFVIPAFVLHYVRVVIFLFTVLLPACNGAIYGVGNAVNNGDTKDGDTVNSLQSYNNNFLSIKGCPQQNVMGPCQGAAGQCPT